MVESAGLVISGVYHAHDNLKVYTSSIKPRVGKDFGLEIILVPKVLQPRYLI